MMRNRWRALLPAGFLLYLGWDDTTGVLLGITYTLASHFLPDFPISLLCSVLFLVTLFPSHLILLPKFDQSTPSSCQIILLCEKSTSIPLLLSLSLSLYHLLFPS
ncbi:hypothetical protein HRR88_001272 [Exophiala dermatitidis]|nr:hypothetical protein HRR84_006600 [Exophiala dermatitidis]KAJ4631725.1 hypothetical protein HRR88_001272 [Exophiala dermatitidis]KAJ4639358.1 hypothetical protein HRR89_004676 [Exophiala dermatitidis]KAJ4654289.1 hypothetical protein HRR91_003781 [Exophiala dermatitidis]KAJ4664265.1 hypothetical protein HRR92_008393 [Exophiala dermatitidis]